MAAAFCAGQSTASKPVEYPLEPIAISNCDYPPSPLDRKAYGKVTAMMLVSESGTVENVQVFKADPTLADVVDATIRGWKFKPVLSNGEPIAVVAKVICDYVSDTKAVVKPDIAPGTEFPHSVRVSETVSKGMLVRQVTPKYPTEAQAKHVRGTVVVSIVIDKQGNVADARVVSGPAELISASIDAVRQWQFRPYHLLGRPVDVQSSVQFNFN